MKHYAVKIGVGAPIIVNSWDECSKRVIGFKGAVFKSFLTAEEAEAYLQGNEVLPLSNSNSNSTSTSISNNTHYEL